MSELKKLNNQELIFTGQYLICLDPQEAAIFAKYSKTTARTKAYLWVSDSEKNPKPHVYQAVQAAMAKREKRTEITQDMVVKELARLAFVDHRKFYDENNHLIPITELDDDTAAALAGFEHVTIRDEKKEDAEYVKKIKTYDKKGSLELLGRHLKMFTDNIHFTGDLDITVTDTE